MNSQTCACGNMPWERSLVPVQATLGEAGLKKKGIAGFNESQVDTGEINKKDSCDTHKHACTKKKEVVHPINSVIIY